MGTILFDCDGVLVGSEELAFQECTGVVNDVLTLKRTGRAFTVADLLEQFVGCNCRRILERCSEQFGFGFDDGELERWVREEEDRVISRLMAEVQVTDGLAPVLEELSAVSTLMAVVSSSALRRVRACLEKTSIDRFFGDRVYSAASLSPPKSKPDPAIYLHAIAALGAGEYLAIEDSPSGMRSARAAMVPCLGFLGDVPAHEQDARERQLRELGAVHVIRTWGEFLPFYTRFAA